MTNGLTRAIYRLCHGTTEILSVDASLTPPFTVGEVITPYNNATGEEIGPYVVTARARRMPYHQLSEPGAGRIALAGQELIVQVELVAREEEA